MTQFIKLLNEKRKKKLNNFQLTHTKRQRKERKRENRKKKKEENID